MNVEIEGSRQLGKPQSPKIFRVITRLNIGGPAYHCLTLCEELERPGEKGFQNTLVTGSISKSEGEFQITDSSFRIIRLNDLRREPSLLRDIRAFFALWLLFMKEKPDIVHTHLAKAGALARLAAYFARVPIILHTYHGHVFSGYFSPKVSAAVRGAERCLAKLSTALITLSPQLKDEIQNKHRVGLGKQIFIVPLGRDLKPFGGPKPSAAPLAKELGLDSGAVRFLGTIGRLVPIKNHALLLDGLALLEQGSKLHLLVAGEGELRPSLEAQAQKLGIAQRVHFLGWRKDLPNLLQSMDFLVLSSINEGTPLCIIESFAAAVPVISTQVGGVADLFTEPSPEMRNTFSSLFEDDSLCLKAEGILVRPAAPKALAQAMDLFSKRPDLLTTCAINARRRSEAYNSSALVENISNLYNKLLRQRGLR